MDNNKGLKFTLNDDGKSYKVSGVKDFTYDEILVIPENYKELPVTQIENRAFDYCTSLVNIQLPSSITAIGSFAFSQCRSLKTIKLPPAVTRIENGTFYWCNNLVSIELPDSLTDIGENAFGGCFNLDDIKIPTTVSNIGKEAFLHCKSLTSITIPSKITVIEEGTFRWCKSLVSINIPDLITTLGDNAFEDCKFNGLITLPTSIKSIGSEAFKNCDNLTGIILEKENENYTTIDGVLYNKSCSEILLYPAGKPDTEFFVPSLVNTIKVGAFSNCKYLKKLTLTSTMTNIERYTFKDCLSLTDIEISESIENIEKSAFNGCINLVNIIVNEANQHYKSIDGVLYNKLGTDLIYYPEGKKIAVFEIPATITCIKAGMLSNRTNLTGIKIPSSVTCISDSAFSGCENLLSIEIPSSVKTIGNEAFWQCINLRSINFDDQSSLVSIGERAFAYCENLLSIEIPKGVKELETQLFVDCKMLTKISLPESIIKLGSNLFKGCKKIKDLTIPGTFVNVAEKKLGLELKKIDQVKVIGEIPEIISGPFTDKVVCFTGTLEKIKREDAQLIVENMGGETSDIINKKVNVLVIGKKAGSKVDKAEKLGINVIDEHEFIRLININAVAKFNLNEDQKNLLDKLVTNSKLSKKQHQLIEKYIEKTGKPCYSFEIASGIPTHLDSSIGGVPYLPVGKTIPTDENGNPMALLVQLNLEGINLLDYPNKGILQIFIQNESGNYPTPYNVRYYETISENYQKNVDCINNHWTTPLKINLIKNIDFPSPFLNEAIFNEIFVSFYNKMMKTEINEFDEIEEHENIAHILDEMKLKATFGGYGMSTQAMDFDYFENEILMALDSSFNAGINIGDAGVIWAIISKTDLKSNNITAALVDWDCA